MTYLIFTLVLLTAVSLKKSLDKIEEHTSKLREYTYQLLKKTEKIDKFLNLVKNLQE
jgi:hypothetical protein